jgi:hypothetical protein
MLAAFSYLPGAAAACARGQTLSAVLRSGNRKNGSRVTRVGVLPPKSRDALNVRLPLNQTSAGYVTIAVFASTTRVFALVRSAAPPGANSNLRTTGDGISPACRTVTVVVRPFVATF